MAADGPLVIEFDGKQHTKNVRERQSDEDDKEASQPRSLYARPENGFE
jgi:very-short-patch-repair endonuclease